MSTTNSDPMQARKLSAEAMLSAHRRGIAIPNFDGTLALSTLSTPQFGKKSVNDLCITDLETGDNFVLLRDSQAHEAAWIPNTSDVIFLQTGELGQTEVVITTSGQGSPQEQYVAGAIDAAVTNLKLKAARDGTIIFVVTALVGDDGRPHREDGAAPTSSGRIFDSATVRVWNTHYNKRRYSLWYNKMFLRNGKWTFDGPLVDAVGDAGLEAPLGVYDLGMPLSNFDISENGIAFIARDLRRRKPEECQITLAYYTPFDSVVSPPQSRSMHISLPEGMREGKHRHIRFSPDGLTIAFLHAESGDLYANQLFLAPATSLAAVTVDLSSRLLSTGEPHDPPFEFEFMNEPNNIMLKSQKHGRVNLATVNLADGLAPKTFYQQGTVMGCYPLESSRWDTVLISGSSMIDSSFWHIFDVVNRKVLKSFSVTDNGAVFGLSPDMVSEFWYDGACNTRIHSFLIRPSDFDSSKKYPWIVIPHGGPVAAWLDSWSYKWNAAAWAEQGYIIFLPNITGSTGYGLECVRKRAANIRAGINTDWVSRPLEDISKLVSHVETLPYLDPDKAIFAAASYGAYLLSWAYGDDSFMSKFCCSVWHAGIYSLPSFILQCDMPFNNVAFDIEAYPWVDPERFSRCDPSRPERVRNWHKAPPTLLSNGERDYRCPSTEGIATFTTLLGQGVPARLLTFPDECHWIQGAGNSLLWHNTVWDWMKKCINGEIKRGDAVW